MSEQQKKRKLLNKYLNPTSQKKLRDSSKIGSQNNVWIRDEDQIQAQINSSSSSEIQQPIKKRRARLQSSDQDQQKQKVKIDKKNEEEKQAKKDKKLKKKLRKALGLGKDEQVQQFLENLQVEGIDKSEILDYLKKNKDAIIKKEDARQDQTKKKKKKDKKEGNNNSKISKFEMFQKSSSSDMEIPEQARTKTIYRNKDGTIKDVSHKQQKQQHAKKVFQRLAQWEKGMKKQGQAKEDQNQHEDVIHAENNKVWNDPMKRWEEKVQASLLACKFEGPPNRYNIRPGCRWDGVVRGNGFQNRYLQEINLKKAKKDKQHMEYMKDL